MAEPTRQFGSLLEQDCSILLDLLLGIAGEDLSERSQAPGDIVRSPAKRAAAACRSS
jgi:hypothetical protein